MYPRCLHLHDMFERMQKLIKDQPDWLEVPMPTGMYEELKQALVQFGASPEQAVNLFAKRIIAVAAKDRPKPTLHTISNMTIQDMLPQMMIEPEMDCLSVAGTNPSRRRPRMRSSACIAVLGLPRWIDTGNRMMVSL